ncbi:hypothetical protein KY285_005021 [Solanum tuberosum]|nr:hypothetical protein KY285_005021 [Solanum tuberosum]
MFSGAVNLAGASHHMTYNKATLTNIRPLPSPFLISLPNCYKVKVTEVGDGPSLKIPLELGRANNGNLMPLQVIVILFLLQSNVMMFQHHLL